MACAVIALMYEYVCNIVDNPQITKYWKPPEKISRWSILSNFTRMCHM